ncbi:hypothetical protein GJ496_010650 [Pomphorhynchus laevis]|nr:hypothetical protein GJ496_010650 [Pomphorhynchus laevis]
MMFRHGKVSAAMRLLQNQGNSGKISSLDDIYESESIRERLEWLHPNGEKVIEELILEEPFDGLVVHREALFTKIDATKIKYAARKTSGSAGPFVMDS